MAEIKMKNQDGEYEIYFNYCLKNHSDKILLRNSMG